MNAKSTYILLEIIDNLTVGGGQNMLYELVNNIDKSQYKPYVLCYGPKRNTQVEEKIERLCPVKYLSISHTITPFDMIKVLSEISKIKPDIVHAHLGGITFGLPWCLLHNRPFIVTAHTSPQQAFSKNNEKILRYGLKHNKAILVAVSEDNSLKCKSYFELNESKCFFVNNGIDISRYYAKEHDCFTFINVARQDENKNQTMILKCFYRLHQSFKDTRLILAGDGPIHDRLKEYIAQNHMEDCVCLPGMIQDPENYYAISDVYVQSSHREAMPLSVLEALAAGLPILSTDVGGLKDVVKENGFLVTEDENLFYDRMRELYLMSSDRIMRMKIKSKEIVEKFSSSKMASRYMDIFNGELNKYER